MALAAVSVSQLRWGLPDGSGRVAPNLQAALVDEGFVKRRPVVVLVADDRGFVRGEFPFRSREDADKYLKIVRSHGVRAWLEGEAEGSSPSASLKPY